MNPESGYVGWTPNGGYFHPCCPDWNSAHVEPTVKNNVLVWWECTHCHTPHFTTVNGQMWDDEIPFESGDWK